MRDYQRFKLKAQEFSFASPDSYMRAEKAIRDTPLLATRRRKGIPSDLLKTLENVLLACAPLNNPISLKHMFIDSRISVWRDDLPTTASSAELAQTLISFLYEHYDYEGSCALVLFLWVLCDRTNPKDSCHRKLFDLATELECWLA